MSLCLSVRGAARRLAVSRRPKYPFRKTIRVAQLGLSATFSRSGAVLSLGRLDACANLYVGLAEAQPYERAFFEIKGVLPQAHSIGRSRNRCLPPSLLMLRERDPTPRAARP